MDNFNNNQNNDNNSYGEYYFSPAPYVNEKRNGKGKKAAALAILIVVCVVMSSIGTAFMLSYLHENGKIFSDVNNSTGSEEHKTPSSNKLDGGVKDSATITKNPNDKVNLVEGTLGSENMSVAQVSALVADSVVEVTTSSVEYDMFYGQQVVSGAGSGVIFGRAQNDSTKYYIVTNHHVMDGADSVSVRLRDGSEYPCTIVGSDLLSDIGVLQIISDKELTVAELGNSDNIVVGENVVVIGNPLGKLGGTVTDGIISALERKVTIDGLDMTLLQHNAAISPGNSGGGMFNSSGYLIGVINAKSVESSAEGLGFAIPINYAYDIICDILSVGYVTGRAGFPFALEEYASSNMFGTTSRYVVVTSQNNEGGVKFNDVIYSIDDVTVSALNDIISILSSYEVGDTVSLKVARTVGRDVKLFTYDITLVESSPEV
jgi:serine protease Do